MAKSAVESRRSLWLQVLAIDAPVTNRLASAVWTPGVISITTCSSLTQARCPAVVRVLAESTYLSVTSHYWQPGWVADWPRNRLLVLLPSR